MAAHGPAVNDQNAHAMSASTIASLPQSCPKDDVEQVQAISMQGVTRSTSGDVKLVDAGSFNSLQGTEPRLRDGAGFSSTADWSTPRAEDKLHALRASLREIVEAGDLCRLFQRNISALMDAEENGQPPPSHLKQPWISDQQVQASRRALFTCLLQNGFPATDAVEPGQPFLLDAWEATAALAGDRDLGLFPHLKAGVPSGFFGGVEATGLFPPSRHFETEFVLGETACCLTSWKSAEGNIENTLSLLQKQIDEGWLRPFPGSEQEAKAQFGTVGIGSFSVAQTEGSDDRLCGDCSCSLVNAGAKRNLPETTECPTHGDTKEAFRRNSGVGHPRLAGFSIDIKSAHMRVRLRKEEHGLVMFALANKLYYYVVNCFGACWAQWWWGRCGASLLRLCHMLLHTYHFGFVYVDDYLFLVPEEHLWGDLCLIVLFLSSLGVPLSWHKIRANLKLRYIGILVLAHERTLELPEEKFLKADGFLRTLTAGSKIPRKEFEKGLGFLMYVATIATYLKPWLSALFQDMFRAARAKIKLDSAGLAAVFASLDDEGLVAWDIPWAKIKRGWRPRKRAMSHLRDGASSPVSIDFMVPTPSRVTVSEMSSKTAKFLATTLRHMPSLVRCSSLKQLQGCGAADACAQGEQAGIGGWWALKQDPEPGEIFWFSLVVGPEDFPSFALAKDAQRDIAFYECVAQVILLSLRLWGSGPSSCCVGLTHDCDNSAVVGGARKMFTSKEPLCFGLQMLSAVATAFNCEIEIKYLPGISNTWADALSRPSKLRSFRASLDHKRERKVDIKAVLRSYWGL